MLRKRIAAMLLSMALCSTMVAEASAAAFTAEPTMETVDAFGDGASVSAEPEAVVVPEVTVAPEITVDPENQDVSAEEELIEAAPEDLFTSETVEFQSEVLPEESEELADLMDEFAGATLQVSVEAGAWEAKTVDGAQKFMLRKTDSAYYTSADGVISVTTITSAGTNVGRYIFDENGYMITGRKVLSPGTAGYPYSTSEEFYFMEAANADLRTEAFGTQKTPVNSNIGQMASNFWLWDGTAFRLYANSGKFTSVDSLIASYTAENKYKGYFKINGDYYRLNSQGVPQTGYATINNKLYYFQTKAETGDIPGKLFYNGWRKSKDSKGIKWEYSYRKTTDSYDIGEIKKVNGYQATAVSSDGIKYLLDKNGYIQKGKRVKAINGYYYLSDSKGRVYTNKLVKLGNYRYYFTSSGAQATWKNCWKRCSGAGNRYYYFGSTAGRVVEKKKWQKVYSGNKFIGWFYFGNTGNHYMNKWAGERYFTSTGKMASGLTKVSGTYYFFEESTEAAYKGLMVKDTMVTYKNKTYYAQSNGKIVKSGWRKINGNYYYFSNYKIKTKSFAKLGNKYGYLDATGKYCTGWVIVSNALNRVRYVDSTNGCFYKNTNVVIDGLRYYFDSNGYRINDLTNIYTGPYYLRVDKTNGVMTVYDAATRTVPVKTIRVSVGNPISLTPNGTYRLNRAGRWQSLMGPSWGQYGSHVAGAGRGGIFVHSIACSAANSYNLPAAEYNKLGNPASHGCIRCCVADAKWVYENCNGATINIYQGAYKSDEALKGPLGRRRLEPLRSPYNYDPTDPTV